ncbi:hypothetical protein BDA96_01G423000 [Sorghum bicolor]|uniref:Uncharacterized protein n=2 Tax=Sorghum bicolor TaxID=4558 RepID=A0A921S4G4_SORBI|nr:hypothetical protein BDA96_01G423000 [Sorghum bicolor]OQU92722.1 hypothetical protein SORBI_3001G397550 [Sorghum bicolor]
MTAAAQGFLLHWQMDGELVGWTSNTFLDKLHHNIPKQATTIVKCDYGSMAQHSRSAL